MLVACASVLAVAQPMWLVEFPCQQALLQAGLAAVSKSAVEMELLEELWVCVVEPADLLVVAMWPF